MSQTARSSIPQKEPQPLVSSTVSLSDLMPHVPGSSPLLHMDRNSLHQRTSLHLGYFQVTRVN